MPSHFRRGKYREEERVIGPSLDAIDRSYDLLLALPDHDSTTFFTVEDHKAAWRAGAHDEAAWHLFWDAYNWLKFFWYTSAFKARQLGNALIYAYNSDNHLAWLILARSSLEYAAVSYYFANKIHRLSLQGPAFNLSQLKIFEDVMLQYSHGSRFDWSALMAGDHNRLKAKFEPMDVSKSVNVMTALEHLARRDSRYEDVKIGYEMLSDFAHPNMASHATVAEMPGTLGTTHETRLAVAPGALRGEFIAVVSLPWVSCALGTSVEVLVDTAPLLKTWLDYVDQRGRITIDLTK